ncbi:hypothetical protein F7725_013719 [Dissostichus mawsoni]|uniref:Uncharacterized protein n=1 Tax=Dissostichus mawsoni TaxID=36200 RepID=A0A7J5YW33_DISMA|nr:hypothetical protein F7725_013719 [Dissostichus mawsoni]
MLLLLTSVCVHVTLRERRRQSIGACMICDVDIICISVTEKLPFFFKRAPVNGATERGVVFEVSYAAALRDSTRRRYTIANSTALMESCRGGKTASGIIYTVQHPEAPPTKTPGDTDETCEDIGHKQLIGPSRGPDDIIQQEGILIGRLWEGGGDFLLARHRPRMCLM